MSNRFQAAFEHLADRLEGSVSIEILYRRGVNTCPLTATLGNWRRTVTAEGGVSKVISSDQDFLVRAADLVLGGVATEPARNDEIVATIGGTTSTFKVLPPGGEEKEWRYSDSTKVRFRIHTVKKA